MESRGSERVHSDELFELELNENCRRFESFLRDNDGPASELTKKGIQNGGSGGEVDMQKIEYEESKRVLDKLIKHPEDNESLLLKLKHRFERVSIEQPKVEVRFENINVDAEAYVGGRAIPTIFNSCVNAFQDVLHGIHILPNKKEKISILQDVSGILTPGRMTLLLGPPGSGKTTLLSVLAGKATPGLKVSGNVTYNGHKLDEFVPEKTSAYVSEYDVHMPELTVRETLNFSARCQGAGYTYDLLGELLRREKQANIEPDPDIDVLMKALVSEQSHNRIVTDYILRILGLEVCADTMVGNEMIRGVSGGQRKRVTTGEMLVGHARVLLMDSISTGLDSSTTFQIVNAIKQSIHIFEKTAFISLLQPPPETYELFDDIILMSDGQILYQGPREYVLEFFESMGFKCPERKAVADYLQEVTSRKDQGRYWAKECDPYYYVSVNEFAEAFKSFHVGTALQLKLATSYDKSKNHPAALTKSKYASDKKGLLKACLWREFQLMKKYLYVHFLNKIQLAALAVIAATAFVKSSNRRNTFEDGIIHLNSLFYGIYVILFTGFFELPTTINKLAIFYKQRSHLFYPSWAFSLPASVVGFPIAIFDAALWICVTYKAMGFDPSVARIFKYYLILASAGQLSYVFYRCVAVLSGNHVVANITCGLFLVWLITFSGFTLSKSAMVKWLRWAFWTSPMMYELTALTINEFQGETWNRVPSGSKEGIGIMIMKARGMFTDPNWYWIGFGGIIGFIFLLNGFYTLSLAYLKQYGNSQAVYLSEEALKEKHANRIGKEVKNTAQNIWKSPSKGLKSTSSRIGSCDGLPKIRGMTLPFTPLSITFNNIKYSVDLPKERKAQGATMDRLLLLKGVSGVFKPGVLTALMGVSGAGKTTLLDVLAGRKNTGNIEGSIQISGYPKKQETFARVAGYCEQNDIHSPLMTVYESLLFSAWLRLDPSVDPSTRQNFVEEVMELIELTSLKDSLVGTPNINGLSVEQRKRLTIAVELVANPSIIFMDEPTSGLDSRAAAIVMRTVRNTVNTGRTVVCTIHQPSIDIFESFDELILLKQGGEEIYVGPLGHNSNQLITYFEGINGVGKSKEGQNPATWMMEVTSRAQEELLGIDFAEVYKRSNLFQRNKALISELSVPAPNSQDLHFPSQYSRSFVTQCMACLWKQHKSYWRNTAYNLTRFVFNTIAAIIFGFFYQGLGSKRSTKQGILDGISSMYAAVNLIGTQNASSVRPVILIERAVYYRERAAGLYSSLPYAMAQVAIEIPYALVQALIYGILVYFIMDYELTAAKFFLYLFYMYLTVLYFTFYGMMIVALSPNLEVSTVLGGFCYSLWNMFSGFFIPRTELPVWWSWFAWICPYQWSLYGLATSQYGNVDSKLDTGETVAEFVENYFGFRYDFLGIVAGVLVALSVIFIFTFAYSIKNLNFHKR